MSSILLSGNIGKTLRVTATPMVVALFAVGATGIVDAYFVSRLGTKALAGLGFCIPLFYLVVATWIGFGIGVTSMLARFVGAGELQRARRVGVDALFLASMLLVALVPGFIALKPAFFSIFGVPGDLQPATGRYVDIIAFGMPGLALVTVASAILRGHGAIKASGALMILASLANIALDPVFILGFGPVPAFGLGGAALAAAGGYLIAALFSVVLLLKRRALSIRSEDAAGAPFAARVKGVLAVSLPAVVAQLVRPLALLGLTAVVSRFGEAAVAAFATGANVERVVVNVYLGLASALTPFVGQNWGARQQARVSAGVRVAATWALVIGAAAWVSCAVGSSSIAQLFVAESHAQALVRQLLWVLPLGYGVAGVTLLSVSALNAVGRGSEALKLTLIEQLLLMLPLAALGAELAGLNGLFAGMVCARLLAALEARRRLAAFGIVGPRFTPATNGPVTLSELTRATGPQDPKTIRGT